MRTGSDPTSHARISKITLVDRQLLQIIIITTTTTTTTTTTITTITTTTTTDYYTHLRAHETPQHGVWRVVI